MASRVSSSETPRLHIGQRSPRAPGLDALRQELDIALATPYFACVLSVQLHPICEGAPTRFRRTSHDCRHVLFLLLVVATMIIVRIGSRSIVAVLRCLALTITMSNKVHGLRQLLDKADLSAARSYPAEQWSKQQSPRRLTIR